MNKIKRLMLVCSVMVACLLGLSACVRGGASNLPTSVAKPTLTASFVYNGQERIALSGVLANSMVVEGVWKATNAGDYTCYVTLKEDFAWADGSTEAIVFDWSIEKADLSYVAPTIFNAVYGDTLADVELPEGWEWEAPLTTSVGNPGSNKFSAVHEIAETANYNALSVEVEVTIYVSKEMPTYTIPTGLTATYGQTLADVTLPAGWAWKAELTTLVGNVGTRTHLAVYTVAETGTVQAFTTEKTLSIAVAKATPSPDFTIPTGLNATVGQTLADIQLPDGWAWKSALTTLVGDEGDQRHVAVYSIAETTNFNAASWEREVSVKVGLDASQKFLAAKKEIQNVWKSKFTAPIIGSIELPTAADFDFPTGVVFSRWVSLRTDIILSDGTLIVPPFNSDVKVEFDAHIFVDGGFKSVTCEVVVAQATPDFMGTPSTGSVSVADKAHLAPRRIDPISDDATIQNAGTIIADEFATVKGGAMTVYGTREDWVNGTHRRADFVNSYATGVELYLDPSAMNTGDRFLWISGITNDLGADSTEVRAHFMKTAEGLKVGTGFVGVSYANTQEVTANGALITDAGWYTIVTKIFADQDGQMFYTIMLVKNGEDPTVVYTQTVEMAHFTADQIGGMSYGWLWNMSDSAGNIAEFTIDIRNIWIYSFK